MHVDTWRWNDNQPALGAIYAVATDKELCGILGDEVDQAAW
jgi:hypothetical protein